MAAVRRYICPFIVMFIVLTVSIESYGFSIHPSRDSLKIHFLDYSQNFNKKRLIAVIGTESALYAGVMVGLYNYWYKDLGLSKFHFFNDGKEWRGVDKAGHFMTAYTYTYFGYETFKWAGVSKRKSLWYAFAGSNFLQLSLEFFDGLSPKWGFSYYDILANTTGTSLFALQEIFWDQQRIRIKTSSTPQRVPDVTLRALNNESETMTLAERDMELYGKGAYTERFLKDYNAQVTWLSFNIKSFFPELKKTPSWLNVAVGYGAGNMWGGFENRWTDKDNNQFELDKNLYPRRSRFLMSLDLDLSKIKTKSPRLRTILGSLNFIKIPCPALEFNTTGKVKFYPIYF